MRPDNICIPLPLHPAEYITKPPPLRPISLTLPSRANDDPTAPRCDPEKTGYIVSKIILPLGASHNARTDRKQLAYVVGFTDLPAARIAIPCHEAYDYVPPKDIEDWEYEASLQRDREAEEERQRLLREEAEMAAHSVTEARTDFVEPSQEMSQSQQTQQPRVVPQPRRRVPPHAARPGPAHRMRKTVLRITPSPTRDTATVELPPEMLPPKRKRGRPRRKDEPSLTTPRKNSHLERLRLQTMLRDSDAEEGEEELEGGAIEEASGVILSGEPEHAGNMEEYFTDEGYRVPPDGQLGGFVGPEGAVEKSSPSGVASRGIANISLLSSVSKHGREETVDAVRQSSPTKRNRRDEAMDVGQSSPTKRYRREEEVDARQSSPPKRYRSEDELDMRQSSPTKRYRREEEVDARQSSPPKRYRSEDELDMRQSSPTKRHRREETVDVVRPPSPSKRLRTGNYPGAATPSRPSTPRKSDAGGGVVKSPLPSSPASGISASSPIRSKPSVRQDASSRPSTPTKKATAPRAATPAGTPAETKRNQTATAAERTPEPPAAVDEDQTWEVERLVADALYFPSPKAGKTEKPVRLFRVRWAGDWPPDQKETWEPEENISPALVRDYLRRRAAKKERRRGASGRGRGPGSGKAGGKAAGVAQGQGVATTTTQGRKDRRSPVGSSSGARDGSVTGGSPQPIVSHAYTSVSDAVAGEPVLASAGPAAETLSTAEIEELSRGDGGGSSIDGSAGVDDVLSVDDERLLVAEEDDDEDESDGDGRRDNERTTNAAARNDPLGQDAGTTASPPARIVGGLGGVARGLESLLAMEFAKLARWGS